MSLVTKIAVYRAIVLTSLLYGSETWTLCRHQIRKLDQFHLRCLRSVAGIKSQDRIANAEVLRTCGISCIEAFLLQAQFRWIGHVVRMSSTRIPKQVLCGQLARGKRLPGRRHKRYKDGLKQNLKTCGISPNDLNSAPLAGASWQSRCQDAMDDFEATRLDAIQAKRQARKTTTIRTTGQ